MEFPYVARDIDSYLLYEYKNKENKYAIGSISRDRFIEIGESNKAAVMQAISLMDGTNSFEYIDEMVRIGTGVALNTESLYKTLERANLTFEEGNPRAKKSEYDTLGLKIVEVKLNKLRKFFSALSVLVTPISILVALGIIFTVIFGMINIEYISSVSLLGFEDNYIWNIVSTILIMSVSVFGHELAHAVTAAKYGLYPTKLSLFLYLYVSPAVLIKIPGLYTIKPKQRISVWVAGVTFNSILVCIGIISSILMKQNGGSELAISIMDIMWYSNFVLIIMNLSPLMPLDGYFMLATILKKPNLRQGAFDSIKRSIKNKKIQISAAQCLYLLPSIAMMGYVIINEVAAMVGIFVKNIPDGIGSAFWSIKHYILSIGLIIAIRLIRARALSGGKKTK